MSCFFPRVSSPANRPDTRFREEGEGSSTIRVQPDEAADARVHLRHGKLRMKITKAMHLLFGDDRLHYWCGRAPDVFGKWNRDAACFPIYAASLREEACALKRVPPPSLSPIGPHRMVGPSREMEPGGI